MHHGANQGGREAIFYPLVSCYAEPGSWYSLYAMPRELSIGRHRLLVEADEVLWEVHGECDVDELRQIIALGEELGACYGRYYSLIDAQAGIGVTPAARRFSRDWERTHGGSKALTLIFGSSLLVRTLVTLVNRSARLVLGHAPEIYFLPTEAEAREFIRRDRAAQATQTKRDDRAKEL